MLKDYPILPPSDPEIQRLVSQGTSLFKEDPKKATVCLRLAGRKGYLPAYLLLAQQAQEGKQDDAVLIESLCAVLTSSDAQKQLPKGLLSQCATQLAAVLRDPKNQHEVSAHAGQIEIIAQDWPIINIVKLQASDTPKTRSQAPKPQADVRPALKSDAAFNRIKEAMVKTEKTPEAAPCRGKWTEAAEEWLFSFEDMDKSLRSDVKLEINALYIRLTDSDGKLLVKTLTPRNLDRNKVEAAWSRKQQRLIVRGPKLLDPLAGDPMD